jgi:hypothetical protein
MGTGGTSAAGGSGASSGCSCGLGGISRGARPWGLLLAFGAVMAGMLQRLAVRRQLRAENADSAEPASTPGAADPKDKSDEPLP